MSGFDTDNTLLHTEFPVVIVINRQPAVNRWQAYSWRLTEVAVGAARPLNTNADRNADLQLRQEGDDFFWSGLSLRLYKDEAEAYYHNLVAPKPSLYVMTRDESESGIRPFAVSASFDEANAYMETDADAHSVTLPAGLIEPVEKFVLTYYHPEPRRKRRRENWKT